MAFLGDLNEKLNQVQDTSFEPIPDGWYTAIIKECIVKPTADGTGQRMNVRFDITGPTRAGAVVYEGFNIRNKNPKAEEIALQQMKAMRDACGIINLQDTDQFIGRALQVKVAIQPAKDGYDAKNTVKGFKAVEGGAPRPAPAPAATAQAQAASSTPPWARKQEPVVQTPVDETDGQGQIF